MVATANVTVPLDQGDAVLDTLLTLYQAQAEALHMATLDYLEDRRSLSPVLAHRDELAQVESLIDLVGWRFGARSAALELVGPAALVREVVHATLVDTAEELARGIDRYERGEVDLAWLRARGRAAAALLELFSRMEDESA